MRQNDVDRIVLALVEEGQNNSEKYGFNLGKVMRFTPMQVGEIISNISIEPERKMGRWIRNDNGTWSCNRCHAWIPDEQHYYARYCLRCGVYMGGDT